MNIRPFYIACAEIGSSERCSTKLQAVTQARGEVNDGMEARYVYEVRLVAIARREVVVECFEPQTEPSTPDADLI